jgi:hypothetical protein
VSLYWVVNSTAQIGFNILTYGLPAFGIEPIVKARTAPVPTSAVVSAPEAAATTSARELRTVNGSGRSKRQNRRRRP